MGVGGCGGCRLQLQQDGLHLEAGSQVVIGAAGRAGQGQMLRGQEGAMLRCTQSGEVRGRGSLDVQS